jgi:hypothetical protein
LNNQAASAGDREVPTTVYQLKVQVSGLIHRACAVGQSGRGTVKVDLVRQIIGSLNTLTDAMVRTAEGLSNKISSIFNRK